MKKITGSLFVIIFFMTFFYGISVGLYEIFPYEFLDSSKDVLFGKKDIENNQFINQVNVDSLI